MVSEVVKSGWINFGSSVYFQLFVRILILVFITFNRNHGRWRAFPSFFEFPLTEFFSTLTLPSQRLIVRTGDRRKTYCFCNIIKGDDQRVLFF